jgi:predicted metalloprotease with PDZ domain
MPRRKKLNITVNNLESLQDLMQEVYNDACGQIIDAQNTINALMNGSEAVDVDDHVKLAKGKTDALKLKDSAIKLKLDVGRLQNEIIKHGGDAKKALDEVSGNSGSGASLEAFSKIREFMKEQEGKNGK